MPLNAAKISEYLALLAQLKRAKEEGLVSNPQDEELEAAIKAEIDTEIAE